MFNKKSLSAVVSLGLLIVVSVLSMVSFNNWFDFYQSGVFLDVESRNDVVSGGVRLDGIVGDSMYVYSGENQIIRYFKIEDTLGNEMCSFGTGFEANYQGETDLIMSLDEGTFNSSQSFDFSGKNNNGNITNGVANRSSCYHNGCFKFDGIDDYIDISNQMLGNQNRRGMTFSAFINLNETGNHAIVGGSPHMGYSYYASGGIYINGDKARTSVYNGSVYFFAESDTLEVDRWYNIVGTYDANLRKLFLYVDGGLVDVVNALGTKEVFSTSFIGQNSKLDASYESRMMFNGSIDEVAIYSLALSDDEVKLLYDSGKALMYEQLLPKGIKEFNVSSCNLLSGEEYDVVMITDKTTYSNEVIAK